VGVVGAGAALYYFDDERLDLATIERIPVGMSERQVVEMIGDGEWVEDQKHTPQIMVAGRDHVYVMRGIVVGKKICTWKMRMGTLWIGFDEEDRVGSKYYETTNYS
jgi:hypothetical protein